MTDAMYGRQGEFLFHYTTADTAFRHILPSGRLLLRPYSQMRDPLESKEWFFELEGLTAEARAELGSVAGLALNVLRTNARLVSLTVDATPGTDPLDASFARGYARARMWEQYGERHQGVCLCFRRELVEIFERQRGEGNPMATGDVKYTPGGFATSPARFLDGRFVNTAWHEIRERLGRYDAVRDGPSVAFIQQTTMPIADQLSDALVRHTMDNLDDFLFIKTTDWESEHEFRIVIAEPGIVDDGGLALAYGDALRAVILGEQFPAWQVPAAHTMCRDLRVDLQRMEWIRGIPTVLPVV